MKNTLVVDRARWAHGEGPASRLYRSSDKTFCILGTYLHQCGVPLRLLRDKEDPLVISHPKVPYWARMAENVATLMYLNDLPRARESLRERRLAMIFHRFGVCVKFVGRPA